MCWNSCSPDIISCMYWIYPKPMYDQAFPEPRMYIQKAVTLCGQDKHSLSGQARQHRPCSPEMSVLVDCSYSGARLFTNVAYNYSPVCVSERTHV